MLFSVEKALKLQGERLPFEATVPAPAEDFSGDLISFDGDVILRGFMTGIGDSRWMGNCPRLSSLPVQDAWRKRDST